MDPQPPGNQASLDRALKPGTLLRVRAQETHAWGIERLFTNHPAPSFEVLFTYRHGAFQPYLDEERSALASFLRAGGGAVFDVSSPESPAADLLRSYEADLGGGRAPAFLRAGQTIPGLSDANLPTDLRQAEFGPEWTVAAGADERQGVMAWRQVGNGTIFFFADPRLIRMKGEKGDRVNRDLLAWAFLKALGGPRSKEDARFGPDWYPKWLAHIHRTFNNPERLLTMDEYVRTISFNAILDASRPLFYTPSKWLDGSIEETTRPHGGSAETRPIILGFRF